MSYLTQELKQFIAQKDALLEHIPVATLISDKEGKIHYYNQEAQTLLGYKFLSNNKISDLSTSFDSVALMSAVESLKKNTPFVTQLNCDQNHSIYQLKIIHLPIDQQKENYYLLTLYPFFDTSKKSEKPEKLSTIKKDFRELKQFSRLNAMREISSSLADKLNQPLTAILSYTQAMQRLYKNNASPEDISEAMKRVVINAEKAGNIIRNIRAELKANTLNYQMININALIQECIDLTELNHPLSTIQLSTQFEAEFNLVNIDKIQIKQVIFSLLNNASDALSNSSTLTPQIKIVTQKKSAHYKISISDNGPGLPDKIKNKLFTPFSTTKENSLGIGLSMCHHIIELHHGDINIHTDATQGLTIVTILLPLRRNT